MKDILIRVRVEISELQEITEAANIASLPVSSYLRTEGLKAARAVIKKHPKPYLTEANLTDFGK